MKFFQLYFSGNIFTIKFLAKLDNRELFILIINKSFEQKRKLAEVGRESERPILIYLKHNPVFDVLQNLNSENEKSKKEIKSGEEG